MSQNHGFSGKSREELLKMDAERIREDVDKDAWIAFKQYFDGRGNGAEVKMAGIVISAFAKREQSRNNAASIRLSTEKWAARQKGSK